MKQEVITYADGYGLWWALVPTSIRHNRARAARTAINRELSSRGGSGFAGVEVERICERHVGPASYVAYREVNA